MDKSKYFLDLSKCTEEERKKLSLSLKLPINSIKLFPYLTWNDRYSRFDQFQSNGIPKGKTELTYPEFIKLFEGGETSAENEEFKLFEENQRRAGIRHAMYLLESFKEDYYSVDAKSLYNSIDVLCDFVRSKGAYIEPLNWISKELKLSPEVIKAIAISHQKQMSSTHPHAIIGTIEDAIIEALETFKSKQ